MHHDMIWYDDLFMLLSYKYFYSKIKVSDMNTLVDSKNWFF